MALVLVLDDSRMMRRLICHGLEELGCQVTEGENGRVGLERLALPDLPDLVLVDWNMPEMDGLDFVRAVRSQSNYNNLLLVMVTTDNDPVQRAEAQQAGANDYLLKPVSLQTLRETLQRLGIHLE
jgi:two-component system, chemotaxis family, chemotaxis protein CheY